MYMYLHSEVVWSWLTLLHTDICKFIHQVHCQILGLTSKLKLFWLVTLLPCPLTFWPLNVVMHHGLCQFSAL